MYNAWDKIFRRKFSGDQCVLRRYETKLTSNTRSLITLADISGDNRVNEGVCQIIRSHHADTRISSIISPNEWSETFTSNADADTSQIDLPSTARAMIGPSCECFMQETMSVDLQTRARDFISRAINGIGQPPEKFQSAFMLTAASILIPNVVGEMEWREIGPTICHEMGWNFQNTVTWRYLLAQASRRLGKTRGTSELILNYVLSTPDTHCLVYSNSEAQTQLLRDDILHLIDMGKYIYVGNQKVSIDSLIVGSTRGSKLKLEFINPYNPKFRSTIFFLPGITPHTIDQRVRSSLPFILYTHVLILVQFWRSSFSEFGN